MCRTMDPIFTQTIVGKQEPQNGRENIEIEENRTKGYV